MSLTTPEDWLPVLADRFDRQAAIVANLRCYVDGNAPLPEMGPKTKATWLAFQRKARTNYGAIACSSRANRIRYRDVRVGEDPQSELSKAARRIARDNRLPMQLGDAVWDMLSARRGYLVVGLGEDGRAVITAEQPEQFYGEPDPVYPWRVRAAIKVWRDTLTGRDYALVWTKGARQRFSRSSYADDTDHTVRLLAHGGWKPDGEAHVYEGDPPVWILDRRDGKGLIEPHLDLIDRINLGKLQRLSTAALQAFRQRVLKNTGGGHLPEKDAAGNVINYEEVFEPAPGALWELPEGFDIWESSQTAIDGMLNAETRDAKEFAAVVGFNAAMVAPESANQTAEGSRSTTQQEVDDCRAMIDRIRLAVVACLLTAMRIEGADPGDETVEVTFEPPEAVTLSEQFAALSQGQAAGIALETLQKQVLGWSSDVIEEDRANRLRSQAMTTMAALAGSRRPAPAMTPAATDGDAG